MFFNLIKEINRSRTEIKRLLSKEMSNMYLKVLLRKSEILKTSYFCISKVRLQGVRHADVH